MAQDDDYKERLLKWGNALMKCTSAAGRDGIEIRALIHLHAALICALVETRTGDNGDVAEVFWQLSRHYDAEDRAQQHAMPFKYSAWEFEAASQA